MNSTKVIGTIIGTIATIVFIIPSICMRAWNIFAWEFNLPIFTYGQWIIIVLAIRGLFGKIELNIGK